MRREARLTSSGDYRKVYKSGKSAVNRELVAYFLKKDTGGLRVGISVSRKLGSAVARNRIKRLIREVFRRNEAKIKEGYDIVFIARQAIKEKSFHEVEKAFIDVLQKAGLIKENNEKNSRSDY